MLTVVTVLSLPLTIVPGLFGMNVGGIPFAEHAVMLAAAETADRDRPFDPFRV